ncbi:MAG: EamA family transporter [Alphaproteobacteria bacterium]|nr:EamA family transporter [Alphaproteobacteria bacterium]
MNAQPAPRSSPVRAILWMVAATMMAAVTGGAVRQMGGEYSTFELVFLRGLVATAMMAPTMIWRARQDSLRPRRMKLYLARSSLSYIGTVCLFFALANMPVADTYALMFTVPMFTILLAVLLLKEGAGARAWIVCAVGFAGAMVIVRPGFATVSLAALAALATAACYASANICIRKLTATESPERITAFNSLLMLLMATPLAVVYWVTPSLEHWPWILAIGISNTLGALCHTRALGQAEARVVQPFSFLRLVWSVGVGWMLFSELPEVWTWVGAAIIFGSSYYMLLAERARRRTPPPEDGATPR